MCLVGAQRIARTRSHYSVDGTAIVTGAGKLLLETANACSTTIVAVAAAVIAVAVVAVPVVPVAVVARSIPIIAATVSVTVGIIAIAVRVISIAIGVAEEREAKAAYENEIIKVIVVVVVMPIAAIPIAAIPMAVPIAAVEGAGSVANETALSGREMSVVRPGCGHRRCQHHNNKADEE